MFATYIEREILKNDAGAIALQPVDIYKTINTSPDRPQKK
jgi:hypothetical protein